MVELNTSLSGNSNVTTAISCFLAYAAIQGLFEITEYTYAITCLT